MRAFEQILEFARKEFLQRIKNGQSLKVSDLFMNLSGKICVMLSRLCSMFPIPRPETPMTIDEYQEEEFQTAKELRRILGTQIEFENSCILDLGCGLGGQTVYFAQQRPKTTVGIDINRKWIDEAAKYAKKKQTSRKVDFIRGDAANLPFKADTFEIIIMYHVIEHLPHAFKALKECKRLLKLGGLLYIAFPSWLYPYGAHLWNYIPIPWCHLLFSEKTLVNVMQKMESLSPVTEISHEIEQFQNLSRITIGTFKKIVKKIGFKIMFYEENIKPWLLSFLRFFPFIKEFFISNIVCILKK